MSPPPGRKLESLVSSLPRLPRLDRPGMGSLESWSQGMEEEEDPPPPEEEKGGFWC